MTMNTTNSPFPERFFWGTATAAHQVEGGNVNNDIWLLEHAPQSIFVEPSGDACDHYHRFGEDIALLASLGFNAYRFSVEWSRIEPEEGQFSRAALEHYRSVLAACHEHGITPFVTYHHFTSPRWLIKNGGWSAPQTPERFARFCATTTDYLGDLIGGACTINEANIGPVLTALGHLPPAHMMQQAPWWKAAAREIGTTPANFVPLIFATTDAGREVIIKAHQLAYEAIKNSRGDFPVGLTLALADIQAAPGAEELAAGLSATMHEDYLNAVRGNGFVGVQTYSRVRVGPEGPLPPEEGVEQTDMGYEFWPEALEQTIRKAARIAQIPIIVTENGIATTDDTRRLEYYQRALQGVANCLKDGIDVRGYFAWSALDNYEWMLGYRPTFGLIAVDHETQARTVKPSARWLGKVARNNHF